MSPKHYFLTVKWYRNTYLIYAKEKVHANKAILWGEDELIETIPIIDGEIKEAQDKVMEFLKDYAMTHEVKGSEWVVPHFLSLEEIEVKQVTTTDAELYNGEEMIETLAQLGGFKVTKYLDEEGYFLGYGMEDAT